MSLGDDLKKFAKKHKHNTAVLVRRVNYRVGNSIIMNSPVKEGTLRGNWNSEINSPDIKHDISTQDKEGNASRESLQLKLATLEIGKDFYFTCSLPYGPVVEYGGYPTGNAGQSDSMVTTEGYSKKSPKGMVRISVALFNDFVNAEAAKIKAKK